MASAGMMVLLAKQRHSKTPAKTDEDNKVKTLSNAGGSSVPLKTAADQPTEIEQVLMKNPLGKHIFKIDNKILKTDNAASSNLKSNVVSNNGNKTVQKVCNLDQYLSVVALLFCHILCSSKK